MRTEQVNAVSVTSSNFPNRETFVEREEFCILVDKLIRTCKSKGKYYQVIVESHLVALSVSAHNAGLALLPQPLPPVVEHQELHRQQRNPTLDVPTQEVVTEQDGLSGWRSQVIYSHCVFWLG